MSAIERYMQDRETAVPSVSGTDYAQAVRERDALMKALRTAMEAMEHAELRWIPVGDRRLTDALTIARETVIRVQAGRA